MHVTVLEVRLEFLGLARAASRRACHVLKMRGGESASYARTRIPWGGIPGTSDNVDLIVDHAPRER